MHSKTCFRWLVATWIIGVSAAPALAQPAAPLSLRFADEQVPPGGVVQLKFEVTEPRPISTAGGHFSFGDFDELLGVAVHSAADDAAAIVVVRPQGATVRLVSRNGVLGLDPDYPALTLTMRVPDDSVLGTVHSVGLAGGAEFTGPSGVPYQYEFKPGAVTIAEVPSIVNVTPGRGLVREGGLVKLDGLGFDSTLEVRFEEISLASVLVVDPTLIQVTTDERALMNGMGVQLRYPTGRTTYYSYQRTVPVMPSANALFAASEPAFPDKALRRANVAFEAVEPNIVCGIAVQNVAARASVARLTLVDDGGAVLAQATVTIPRNSRTVRTLSEVFGTTCAGRACRVQLRANRPLQLLGVLGNETEMSATPILPTKGSLP